MEMSDETENKGSATYVLITPEDVEKNLRLPLRGEKRNLIHINLSRIKNWVISRPYPVDHYECFVFLGLFCNKVRITLTFDEMWSYLDLMIYNVNRCLKGTLMRKDRKAGKRSQWNQSHQIKHMRNEDLSEDVIHGTKEQIKYPRIPFQDFTDYDIEISKETSRLMIVKTLNAKKSFIRSCYNQNGVYQSLDYAMRNVLMLQNSEEISSRRNPTINVDITLNNKNKRNNRRGENKNNSK